MLGIFPSHTILLSLSLLLISDVPHHFSNALTFQVPVEHHGSLLDNLIASVDSSELDHAQATRTLFHQHFPGHNDFDQELRLFQQYLSNSSSLMKASTVVQPMLDFYGSLLTGNISLGTPAQNLSMGFDLGSADVWALSAECATCQGNSTLYQRTLFNKTASTTFTSNKSLFASSSNPLLKAKGVWGTDQLWVAGLGNSSLSFGLVNNISGAFAKAPLDGIVGLGWPSLSPANSSAFFEAIQSQLDKPMFSIYIERKGDLSQPTTKGLITYGKPDDQNCVSSWSSIPVSEEEYWQFSVSGLRVGNFKSRTSQEAILYTFSPYLFGPQNYLDWIVNATNSTLDPSYGLYSTNCSSSTLPNIVFTIQGKDYAVPPNNYLIQMPTDKSRCFLSVLAHNFSRLGFTWLLGAPFLRSYCTSYNFNETSISFANTKF